MSEGFQIVWTHTAERDLAGTIDYIALDSPGNALKVLQKIKSQVDALNTNPERGRIVPELQAHGIGQYRELIVDPWRIIFRLAEKRVYILSLIDARRNVEDILLQRLIR
jgi:plasmid stabilization system protein ParE